MPQFAPVTQGALCRGRTFHCARPCRACKNKTGRPGKQSTCSNQLHNYYIRCCNHGDSTRLREVQAKRSVLQQLRQRRGAAEARAGEFPWSGTTLRPDRHCETMPLACRIHWNLPIPSKAFCFFLPPPRSKSKRASAKFPGEHSCRGLSPVADACRFFTWARLLPVNKVGPLREFDQRAVNRRLRARYQVLILTLTPVLYPLNLGTQSQTRSCPMTWVNNHKSAITST